MEQFMSSKKLSVQLSKALRKLLYISLHFVLAHITSRIQFYSLSHSNYNKRDLLLNP